MITTKVVSIKKKNDSVSYFINAINAINAIESVNERSNLERVNERSNLERVNEVIFSDGDKMNVYNIENSKIFEFSMSEESIKRYESEYESDYYTENVPVTRGTRVTINNDLICFAETSLGTFENFIKELDNNNLFITKRIYYIPNTNIRKKDMKGPTTYGREYYSTEKNKVEAIKFLKFICDKNKQKLIIY